MNTSLSTFDFTKPQLLHPAGNLIIFAQAIARFLKQAVFFIIYLVVKQPTAFSTIYFWGGLLTLLILAMVFAYLQYRNYSYHVDLQNQEFIIKRGVFTTSKTVIKFNNILQVNISQNVLQKILSIYSVTLDTAGSDKVEANLYALSNTQALALKDFLLEQIKPGYSEHHSSSESKAYEQNDTPDPLVKIPAKSILIFSVLSNYRQGLALFFAFCITMFHNISDFVRDMGWKQDYDVDVSQWRSWLTVIFFGSLFVILVPFIINLFRYFVRYYDFSLVKNKQDNLIMRYGLFNVKDIIFNKKRVQVVVFRQNKLLKKIGIGLLSLRQIVLNEAKAKDSLIEIPGLQLKDKSLVYDLIFGSDVYAETTELRPKIGLFVSRMIKGTLLWVVVALVVIFLGDLPRQYIALGFGFLLLVSGIYNYLYYKSYRIHIGAEYIIKQYGVWNEEELIVPVGRVQSINVTQTFWQARGNSANIILVTAANDVQLSFFEKSDVVQLSNYILYKVEK